DGFATRLYPDDSAVEKSIQLTIPGDYVLELTVVDERGLPSCEPARLDARAINPYGLLIQSLWRTPTDDDETDTGQGTGTDLDIHFRLAEGYWEDRFGDTDVYFANPHSNWGLLSSPDDDPLLARDDTDGGGPETIVVREP